MKGQGRSQGRNLCLYQSLVTNSALRNMVAVTLRPSSKTIYKCLSIFLTVNLTLLLNWLILHCSLVKDVHTILFDPSIVWSSGEKRRTGNEEPVKEITQCFPCREGPTRLVTVIVICVHQTHNFRQSHLHSLTYKSGLSTFWGYGNDT